MTITHINSNDAPQDQYESAIQSEIIQFLRGQSGIAWVKRNNGGRKGKVRFYYLYYPNYPLPEGAITPDELKAVEAADGMQTSGFPDIEIMRYLPETLPTGFWSPVVFVEVKGPDGSLRQSQERFIAAMAGTGVPVLVPGSYDEFIEMWSELC